jgi:hypothetical protein
LAKVISLINALFLLLFIVYFAAHSRQFCCNLLVISRFRKAFTFEIHGQSGLVLKRVFEILGLSANEHPEKALIDFCRGLPEGLEMFDVIEDPRSGNATRHPFGSILFIALCAILCGMDTCEDFVRFAKAREEWLREWINFSNSTPCGNTFLPVLSKSVGSVISLVLRRPIQSVARSSVPPDWVTRWRQKGMD